MDLSEISLINAIFIQFTITIIITGGLLNSLEPHLPGFFVQFIRFGKYKFGGPPNALLSMLEIPKAWFSHFYVFATIFSLAMCWLTIRLYIFDVPIPEWFITFLDISCGNKRMVKTGAFPTLMAMLLITLQCLRRFYDTHFVQVFSKTGTMNLAHYIVGYFHYYGAILIILSQGDGFVRGSNETPLNKSLNLVQFLYCAPCIALFIIAWTNQFQSNVILANLRKDKTGKIVSQTHKIPEGGYFEQLSAPHMLFEVLLYVSIAGILFQNTSWLYVVAWVLSNQTVNAILTHKWYKQKFPKYPKTRKAIFPGLL